MTAATAPYKREDYWVVPREQFARDYFDCKPGEHVLFGGPTQRGKTTLAFELLKYAASPKCPAYVALTKPKDPSTMKWAAKLNYRVVRDWPAPKKLSELWSENPSGYVIAPMRGDINDDNARAADVTARLIADRYSAGAKGKQGILVMDDTMVKAKVLGLDQHMTTILTMAGAMGLSQWTFVQKPTGSGSAAIWSYGAAEHVFLTHDPDRQSQKRYDEIGGVDPKVVIDACDTLEPFEFLYIKRTEGYLCIVGAN